MQPLDSTQDDVCISHELSVAFVMVFGSGLAWLVLSPAYTQENTAREQEPTMGTAHICTHAVRLLVRVRGGTTLEVVPPRTQTGGWTARVQTWAVPFGAHVRIILCYIGPYVLAL